ncbi:MAG: chemotaxis protein CheA [Elusimicrobia bacterium]|nr:chemotaxis protein CheA [Elusimicrobiota bacterium]
MDFAQFKEVFVGEAQDLLGRVEEALIRLEKNPSDAKLVQDIFRAIHTLKGNAATLDLKKMTELAHGVEDRLDAVAKGKAEINPRVLDALLICLDALRALLREVQEEKDLGVDVREPLSKLEKAFQGGESPPPPVPEKGAAADKAPGIEAAATASASSPTVRVRLRRLDNIINLVEELAITKARLLQQTQNFRQGALAEEMKVLERLINQLQQEALETRMVPVLEIFTRYQRIVRDMAKALGKSVQFRIEDNNISVDRVLLEKINEPLIHLLRNAVDHAIESPEERKKLGKPAAGSVLLRARGEHGYAIIEVLDDGRGINVVKVKEKAMALGIIGAEEAASMPDHEALHLICHPNFSTADKVTEISGRGVGMNVVKDVIRTVNGRLEIVSLLGEGSQFSLYLPLNLAILQALLVRVNQEIYAIPLPDVLEIVSLKDYRPKIVDKLPVISLRGEILPLLGVAAAFGLPDESKSQALPTGGYGVVVRAPSGKAVLHIHGFVGQEEIVVKNFAGFLRMTKGFSSSTIRGDGKVALILDVRGLEAKRS